jgi:hypothetical protein
MKSDVCTGGDGTSSSKHFRKKNATFEVMVEEQKEQREQCPTLPRAKLTDPG